MDSIIYVVLYPIDAVFVFTVLWIAGFWTGLWTGLLQKILSRYFMLQVDDNRKPIYHMDTTQKHYPRIRLPYPGLILCGKKLYFLSLISGYIIIQIMTLIFLTLKKCQEITAFVVL